LVPTPNDFGRQGQPPTHPELLDHLARHLIASGWSIKALHRYLMLSRTYQLTSLGDLPAAKKDRDIDNSLLWKFRRQRLDAEAIRDAMLALSGQLDRTMGGAHPFPPPHTWDFTQHKPFRAVYDSTHRSVYLMTQRIQRHPYLAIFDGPDTGASTAQRITSTTPLQALYLLNDAFVHAQAKAIVAGLPVADNATRITQMYERFFGRSPSTAEQNHAAQYLERVTQLVPDTPTLAWESYVRTLLRLNEFVYVN
jgi:hypothetical protein